MYVSIYICVCTWFHPDLSSLRPSQMFPVLLHCEGRGSSHAAFLHKAHPTHPRRKPLLSFQPAMKKRTSSGTVSVVNLEKYFPGGSLTQFLEMEDKISSSTLNSGNHHSKLNRPNKCGVYDRLRYLMLSELVFHQEICSR